MDSSFTNVPYHLGQCPDCFSKPSSINETANYKWARELLCDKCSPNKTWFICVECPHQKTHMCTNKQLRRHYFLRHKLSRNEISNTTSSIETKSPFLCNNTDTRTVLEQPKADVLNESTEIINLLSACFSRKENFRFFQNNYDESDGVAYLVGRACFNDNTVGNKIDSLDVEINFRLSKLCLQLSKVERDELSEILHMVTKKFTSKKEKDDYYINLPQTPSSVRQRFMEGSYAMLPNLPHPEIRTSGEFSYLSINDCVADLLAHGVTLQPITSDCENRCSSRVDSLVHSEAARNIYRRSQCLEETPDVTLCITEWSDGFQPNTSSKQNRGSVYIKTISFPIPENTKWNSTTYTYCIVLGPVKSTSENVEEFLSSELNSFQQVPLPRFYSKEQRSTVSVYLEIICVLQDQPERRKVNHLAYGNSNFHARWGWSCSFKSLNKIFPSCTDCETLLIESRKDDLFCKECLSWDLDVENPLCQYDPPGKFPRCSTRNGKIVPFQLTYDILKEAVNMTHNKVSDGTWSPTVGRAYLAVHCFNTDSANTIIGNANNCKLLQCVRSDTIIQQLEWLKNSSPEKFSKWEFPSVWSRKIVLQQHIDTVMHLLFLGGTKTIMIDVHSWLTSLSKLTAFKDISKNMYEDIQSLNLSWCRTLPYGTGKFGSHVSENYLACTRLLKWFYQGVRRIRDEEEEYIEPIKPQDKWTKADNTKWLKHHAILCTGNAEAVRLRVKENRNSVVPPLQIVRSKKESIELFESTISSWVNLVSSLMQKEMTEERIAFIICETKIFLNFYSRFEQCNSQDKYPVWIRHFNFLSLLNLPQVIEKFGPLRNLWEGGVCGEAIISYVKPEITMGLRKNWSSSLLRKVSRKKAFDSIDQARIIIQESKQQTNGLESYAYYKYTGRAEVSYLIEMKKPLSCVIEDCSVYVVLVDDTMLQIEVLDYIEERVTLSYFVINIMQETSTLTALSLPVVYGLILPLQCISDLGANNNSKHVYTIVTSDWTSLNRNRKFSIPIVDAID